MYGWNFQDIFAVVVDTIDISDTCVLVMNSNGLICSTPDLGTNSKSVSVYARSSESESNHVRLFYFAESPGSIGAVGQLIIIVVDTTGTSNVYKITSGISLLLQLFQSAYSEDFVEGNITSLYEFNEFLRTSFRTSCSVSFKCLSNFSYILIRAPQQMDF